MPCNWALVVPGITTYRLIGLTEIDEHCTEPGASHNFVRCTPMYYRCSRSSGQWSRSQHENVIGSPNCCFFLGILGRWI